MSADALAAFFAARGFPADRDGVLVISGDDEVERFHAVLNEARRELPASAFRGAAVHPAAPLDPYARRSIPVRRHSKTYRRQNMQNAEHNHAETFAPLVAAGFPAVQPGEAFVVAGDDTLGLAQGAAQALPAPWVLLAYSVDHLDEPTVEGPRQWRCVIVDNVAARGGEAFPCVPDDDDEA